MSKKWTFFTNHGHILFLLDMMPDSTVLEIATKVGITERATRRIIADLSKDNFIKIKKNGRKNVYKINGKRHLKHPVEKACCVEGLIDFVKEQTKT